MKSHEVLHGDTHKHGHLLYIHRGFHSVNMHTKAMYSVLICCKNEAKLVMKSWKPLP